MRPGSLLCYKHGRHGKCTADDCTRGHQNRGNSKLLPLCSHHLYAHKAVTKCRMAYAGIDWKEYRRDYEAAGEEQRDILANHAWDKCFPNSILVQDVEGPALL